jgi:monothiol glutaredoxin
MSLDPALRTRIEETLSADPVVLFMKGVRGAPQCGFSATVCQILDRLIPEYRTINVLEDPALREGIKTYASWPTVPQLYVRGEFVGGCDILQEMNADGSLHETLGVERPAANAPTLHLSDAAASALGQLTEQQQGRPLHLAIDASFQTGLFFGPEEPGELSVVANGVTIHLEPMTAARADDLRIDVVEGDGGPGFQIDNPNAPKPKVGQLTVHELQARLAAGERFAFYDVRTPEERATAHIEGAQLLDADATARIEAMDRTTTLVFHCHHGGRSQAACEHFAALGFTDVWNVEGGIDAWSQEIDTSVPRY